MVAERLVYWLLFFVCCFVDCMIAVMTVLVFGVVVGVVGVVVGVVVWLCWCCWFADGICLALFLGEMIQVVNIATCGMLIEGQVESVRGVYRGGLFHGCDWIFFLSLEIRRKHVAGER